MKNPPVNKGDLICFSKHQGTKTFAAVVLKTAIFRIGKDKTHYAAHGAVLINSIEENAAFYYSIVSKELLITMIFDGSFINHAKVTDIIRA